MTEKLEQTEDKKELIRRAYKSFRGLNTTYKVSLISYFAGIGITVGSIIGTVTREIPPEVREYNILGNELSYPSPSKTITTDNLLNDRYMDSLRTALKNIKAKRDSLESLASFNKAKKDSERLSNILWYSGLGGIGVMAISIPSIRIAKQRKKK
jgi:hypothetical protein